MYMKTINLLLGNSDRRVSNLIEVLVRDVCYNQAVVNCIRAARVDELTYKSCHEEIDLIIFSPDSLLPAPRQAISLRSIGEGIRAIRALRNHQDLPIIAVASPAQHELLLTESGVDCVLGLPFNCDEVKGAVRRFLSLPELVEETTPEHSTSVGAWARGFQRLSQVFSFAKSS
jgi:hypothetical protein